MIITIDREGFAKPRLELWLPEGDGFERKQVFTVAVGAKGTATPRGVYAVVAKSRTPAWDNPATPEYDPIDYEDPENPFAGGFISLSGGLGVGIHGTKFPPQVGTRASHGCVRMEVKDFKSIYDRVKVGTVVVVL
jgi:lipoprotein-anchoring transpeptidase ErfK/SrfK